MLSKEIRTSYYPNYLSIQTILAAEVPINCRTVKRLPKFGFLVPEYLSEDIPVEVDFQLPVWACRALSKQGRSYISVTLPAGLAAVYWDLRKTTVVNTNLKEVHPQFYEVGQLCASLFHPDSAELSQIIPELLLQRILSIGASTIPYASPHWLQKHYSREMIPEEFMDLMEYQLFQGARQTVVDLFQWMEPITFKESPPKPQEQEI